MTYQRLNSRGDATSHSEDVTQTQWARGVTCSVDGRPRPLQRAQPLASEGDVLLVERQALRLQQLPTLLLPQDGVHRLQEVHPALWGAGGRAGMRWCKGGGGGGVGNGAAWVELNLVVVLEVVVVVIVVMEVVVG